MLYTIADPHLSSDGKKSMSVFGARWTGYMEKLQRNWRAVVRDGDTVILPGDISWALKLEDSVDDLALLHSLPGTKLLGKGNHDFWWSTAAKMNALFEANGFSTLKILYNNAYRMENCVVCGTRGWFAEEDQQNTVGNADYEKIVNREVIRLRLSLDEAARLRGDDALPILVFLHFPPVWCGTVCREIVDTLHEYGITDCYFGHIHGAYTAPPVTEFEDIRFTICASDYLNFSPMPVFVR